MYPFVNLFEASAQCTCEQVLLLLHETVPGTAHDACMMHEFGAKSRIFTRNVKQTP